MEGVLSTNDDGDLDYTHYDEDRGCYPLADVTRERLPDADPGRIYFLRDDPQFGAFIMSPPLG